MTSPIDTVREVAFANVFAARVERVSWPTVGSAGTQPVDVLADLQHHDPTGREWVSIYYFPDSSDRAEGFFGPITAESETVIRIDLGHRHPTPFLKRFCTVRRVPGGAK